MSFARNLSNSGLATTLGVVVALAGCGGSDDGEQSANPPAVATSFAVAKASCGPGDRPEAGLQGQVPMAERTAGFKGYNCNLEPLSASVSSTTEGEFEQFVMVRDRNGRTCGYAGPGLGKDEPGTSVVDLTDPAKIVETAVLTTAATKYPGEGLRVHEGRGLLVTAYYSNAPGSPLEDAHGFDVYDVGTDCRHPQLLASTTSITVPTAGLIPSRPDAIKPGRLYGHEGAISLDGLTYYVGDTVNGAYHAIDITDPTAPKYLASFQYPKTPATGAYVPFVYGSVHGLSVSNDGNRIYPVLSGGTNSGMIPQTGPYADGFMVVDSSEIQARLPNPKMRMISETISRENSWAQMTIPVTIKGQKYAFFLGERGAGQMNPAGYREACAAGLRPFAHVHLYYMGDENSPQLINRLQMETNDPAKCDAYSPELDTVSRLLYDVHMCTVDDRDNATTLACGYFQSGIRVYDIRDPRNIKEIAYFNPAAKTSGVNSIKPCSALPFLDAKTGMLFGRCQDSGVVVLKFKNGVWPFSDSATPRDKQL